MQDLARRTCIPCKGGVPPLKGKELEKLHRQLDHEWQVIHQHHLEKEYRFKTYAECVAFTNRVAAIAEDQNHHPLIFLSYGRVKVSIWTHKIDGLTESDFIFAAKTEEVWENSGGSPS